MTDLQRKAVGYVRVSTSQQEDTPSLGKQQELIDLWAKRHGNELLGIYEDVGSARADGNLFRRHDLHTAIEHANREGAVLVVTKLDRLSRNTTDAARIAAQIKEGVVSIADDEGNVQTTETVLKAVRAAQEEAEKCAKATIEALKSIAASGKKLGSSSAGRRAAAMASAKVRKNNALIAVEEIARVLAESEANRSLTTRELMQLLNSRKIRSGSGREWSLEGLRVPRRKAEKLLLEQAELDAEQDDGPFAAGTLRTDDFGSSAPVGRASAGLTPGAGSGSSQEVAEEVFDEAEAQRRHYANHPLFGVF